MRKLVITAIVFFVAIAANSQELKDFKLYNPAENAEQAIAEKVKEAKEKGKHVFIQVGGNWCIWCFRFNKFITEDKDIQTYIDDNFVVYHLNWSKENRNSAVLAKYGFPQRFGFPVFLVLNGEGQLIHTENSAYLEQGEGYSKLKVIEFLKNWCKAALDPAQYKDQ